MKILIAVVGVAREFLLAARNVGVAGAANIAAVAAAAAAALRRLVVAIIVTPIGIFVIAGSALAADTPALVVPATMPSACPASTARAGKVTGQILIAPIGSGQTAEFRSEYDAADWSGSLARYSVSINANAGLTSSAAPVWDAGRLLSGDPGQTPALPPKPTPAARMIYTSIAGTNRTLQTVPFVWSSLPSAERTIFDSPPLAPSAARDGLGEARVNYLRGDRSRELGQPGGIFRRRSDILGAAIRSTPLLVAAPSSAVQDAGYADFRTRYQSRRAAVYLGANDGMLHAFDAADGSELFAYIPNALLPGLPALTSPAYVHSAYVDGNAAAAEAYTDTGWRSVLVSGMGMGAQGVFALDISDPAHVDGGRGALWEFGDRDDPAMGNVFAAPAIARLNVGKSQTRYFALVSSGIDNYRDDGKGRYASEASGVLFLLALDKPASTPWRLGSNYYKLTAPIADPSAPNALGPVATVNNADGSLRYAYAGDLQGNLWRFDFSGAPPWSHATGPGAGLAPLFVARDAAGRRQPITEQPKVIYAPGGGYLILFGTGKFLENADAGPAGDTPQSFYAVRDPGAATGAASADALVRGRSELAQRHLEAASEGGYRITGADFAYAGEGAKKGWYVDFADAGRSGERSVISPVVDAGALMFNTLLPEGAAAADGLTGIARVAQHAAVAPGAKPSADASASAGQGAGGAGAGTGTGATDSASCAAPASRSYVLDALTGLALAGQPTASADAVIGRLNAQATLAPPVLLPLGTVVGQTRPTGQASVVRSVALVQVGADGSLATSQTITLHLSAKRLSWREIANWQALHDAANK